MQLLSLLVLLFRLQSSLAQTTLPLSSATSTLPNPNQTPICGALGIYAGAEGGPSSPHIVGQGQHFDLNTPSACLRDCEHFNANCVSFAARNTSDGELCTFFDVPVSSVFESLSDGDENDPFFTFFDFSCFPSTSTTVLTPSSTSSATTSILSSTISPEITPTSTPHCSRLAHINSFNPATDDAPHIISTLVHPGDNPTAGCQQECQKIDNCLSYAGLLSQKPTGSGKCYFFDAPLVDVTANGDGHNGDLMVFFDVECSNPQPPISTTTLLSTQTPKVTVTGGNSTQISTTVSGIVSPTLFVGAGGRTATELWSLGLLATFATVLILR